MGRVLTGLVRVANGWSAYLHTTSIWIEMIVVIAISSGGRPNLEASANTIFYICVEL